MDSTILISSILITLALIFYSLGVWAEKLSKYLKKWHVFSFWTGLFFDVTGTFAMTKLVTGPFNLFEIHTFTGQIALWLMLIHAIWASFVVHKDDKSMRKKFHNYSLVVWLLWLIPYFGGMLMGMNK